MISTSLSLELRRGRQVATILVAVLILTATAGCARGPHSHSSNQDGPRTYTDGSGPLGASPSSIGDSGGITVRAPAGANSWHATFGSMFLCSRVDEIVTIERVSAKDSSNIEPEFQSAVRVVRPSDSGDLSPVASMLGRPEDSDLGGSLQDPAGFTVSKDCSPRVADFDELLITLEAGPLGIQEVAVTVDYKVDGTSMRTVIPWVFTACGEAISNQNLCN